MYIRGSREENRAGVSTQRSNSRVVLPNLSHCQAWLLHARPQPPKRRTTDTGLAVGFVAVISPIGSSVHVHRCSNGTKGTKEPRNTGHVTRNTGHVTPCMRMQIDHRMASLTRGDLDLLRGDLHQVSVGSHLECLHTISGTRGWHRQNARNRNTETRNVSSAEPDA